MCFNALYRSKFLTGSFPYAVMRRISIVDKPSAQRGYYFVNIFLFKDIRFFDFSHYCLNVFTPQRAFIVLNVMIAGVFE